MLPCTVSLRLSAQKMAQFESSSLQRFAVLAVRVCVCVCVRVSVCVCVGGWGATAGGQVL